MPAHLLLHLIAAHCMCPTQRLHHLFHPLLQHFQQRKIFPYHKKRLNPEVRNEIVRDLVTHMYGTVEKPTAAFVYRVAEMLVDKYPFMADSSASNPYVSALLCLTPFACAYSL